jgi:5'-methylthioadenosine phosphorylase
MTSSSVPGGDDPIGIGVFGGSGLYSLLDDPTSIEVTTPYGPPSGPLHVGEIAGHRVAFLPRHGPGHEFPPHRINYRANVWALHELGVTRILAPCASGSLQPEVKPGHFVVCDQLVDRTYGREQTYFDGPGAVHVSLAEPYCPQLRQVAIDAVTAAGITVHDRGTVVVIQGPRFSTRAESVWFRDLGWHVVNMTQYPEAALARELGICYASVALITDYDVGVEGMAGIEAVTQEQVFAFFERNADQVRGVLGRAIDSMPAERTCDCAQAVDGAEPPPPADGPAGT